MLQDPCPGLAPAVVAAQGCQRHPQVTRRKYAELVAEPVRKRPRLDVAAIKVTVRSARTSLRQALRNEGIRRLGASWMLGAGYATGMLGKPFVAGATKAQILRDYATAHDIDLGQSWGYSDSYSDYPMLAVVGHPTAVNPDFRLRTVARSYDWPIINL